MLSAEDVFSDTYGRFMKNWAFITSLRQVADVALPIASEALRTVHGDFIDRASVDPKYQKMIVNMDGSQTTWDEGTKSILKSKMTQGAIMNARAAIDAASIVFAQSVLDDCASSYLKVCSLANPSDCESIVGDKKISLSTFSSKSYETVRDEMISDKLKDLAWESLLKKIDILFSICTPPKGYSPINDYKYDRNRLKQIDDARQGIIHRDGLGKPIENIDDDLDFVAKTAHLLMSLVNQKYGVQLNVLRVFNLHVHQDVLKKL